MVFLAGTNTKLVRGPGAADFLQLGGCRVALVEKKEEHAFASRAAAIGLSYTRIGNVSGINYSDGRHLSFLVLTSKSPQ
jgi:hypothetical protein